MRRRPSTLIRSNIVVPNKIPIKVGVLFSCAGITSRVERSQLMGTLFAIREINEAGGIDGRELQAIHYDPQCVPHRYRSLAARLVQQDKVNVIFGCYMSSTRKAVIPVVEKWQRLLMYPTLYEGFEFSRNVIYTGAAPNQNSVARHRRHRAYPGVPHSVSGAAIPAPVQRRLT